MGYTYYYYFFIIACEKGIMLVPVNFFLYWNKICCSKNKMYH